MKKIFLVLALVLSLFSVLQNVEAKYTETIPAYADITGDKVYNWNLKIERSVEFLNGNLTVNGDLYISSFVDFNRNVKVTGNMFVERSVDFGGNVTVWWDAILQDYINIAQTLSAKSIKVWRSSEIYTLSAINDVTIWDYADIYNLLVWWNLTVGKSFDFYGVGKVLGNINTWDFPNIEGTLYGYRNVSMKRSVDILGSDKKFKVVWNLSTWDHYENTARTYIYWNVTFWKSSDEEYTSYTGFFGKIDPLLQYNLSYSQIQAIKKKVDSYLYKAEQQTSIKQKQAVYVTMFDYLEDYIESERFDRRAFANLQAQYIGTTNVQAAPITQTPSVNSKYAPILPITLKTRLDRSISRIPDNNRAYVVNVVIEKIDVIIASSRAQVQTQSVIEKINILLGIREYLGSYSNLSTSILE